MEKGYLFYQFVAVRVQLILKLFYSQPGCNKHHLLEMNEKITFTYTEKWHSELVGII